jgi:hypothetical protein
MSKAQLGWENDEVLTDSLGGWHSGINKTVPASVGLSSSHTERLTDQTGDCIAVEPYSSYILNKNINATCKVLVPCS